METAKLVVTFGTGIAAALVASALQVNGQSREAHLASWLLMGSVLMVVGVIVCDRLKVVDHVKEVAAANRRAKPEASVGMLHDEIVLRMQEAIISSVEFNRGAVALVKAVAGIQVLVSSASGAAAALAMW